MSNSPEKKLWLASCELVMYVLAADEGEAQSIAADNASYEANNLLDDQFKIEKPESIRLEFVDNMPYISQETLGVVDNRTVQEIFDKEQAIAAGEKARLENEIMQRKLDHVEELLSAVENVLDCYKSDDDMLITRQMTFSAIQRLAAAANKWRS